MGFTKERIIDVVVITLIITLIVVRIFAPSDGGIWISFFNYISLVIAYVSVYLEIHSKSSTYEKFNVITGVFVIVLIGLVIFAGLIISEVIKLNAKTNDIILLITLLVTLPTRFYTTLILKAVKE